MRPFTTKRRIQRTLNKEQLLSIGKEMSDIISEIEQIEVLKKKVTPLREELTLLGSKYNSGFEDVELECTIEYNTPATGKKSVMHPDTHEPIEVMDMTKEDLQEDLDFTEAEVVDEGTKQLPEHNELHIPAEGEKNAA